MTYVEKELQPIGFKTKSKQGDIGFEQKVILSIGHLKLQFGCACPAYPNIKALGCPLHHDGPGGSWPVEQAKEIPIAIGI